MNQDNGRLGNVAIVDAIEDERDRTSGSFYQADNPVLQPAKQGVTRKRSWKRKLIGWSFILLLIGGGVIALYLLVRVKKVNVSVQADSRRDGQYAKPRDNAANSENGLTAEAINIAREATGVDAKTPNTTYPTAFPTASPMPSPGADLDRKLNFTGNSPVFEQMNNTADSGSFSRSASQNNNTAVSKTESLPAVEPQSRANTTQSLFVDEVVTKPTNLQTRQSIAPRPEPKSALSIKPTPPILPPFGTMLPVRTQGVIFTLRNNSYARLELTREASGPGWSLPKGTILVGRITGSEHDRAFVNVIGFIDPRDNKLVKMTGDVLGSDGAAGIPGKRIGVDRNRLKQTLRRVASSGLQVAGTLAGALTGRGTVVIDGAGYRVLNPISDEARGLVGDSDEKSFVKVEAGRPAYVMVADLPKGLQAVDAPGQDESLHSAASLTGSLTDREVMELILFGTPEELRAAIPLMTDGQRRLALKTLGPENDKP